MNAWLKAMERVCAQRGKLSANLAEIRDQGSEIRKRTSYGGEGGVVWAPRGLTRFCGGGQAAQASGKTKGTFRLSPRFSVLSPKKDGSLSATLLMQEMKIY
jgi:hypothetical protein